MILRWAIASLLTLHHASAVEYPRSDRPEELQSPKTRRSAKVGEAAPSRSVSHQSDVNTWTIFGFADGADTGPQGERTLFQESALRLSRRDSAFSGLQSGLGLAYSINDSAVVWFSASGIYEHAVAATAADPVMAGAGFGATAGLKYQLLDRATSGVGLALQAEPFTQRTSNGSSTRELFGTQFRLIADVALLPGQTFGAVNIAYEPQAGMSNLGVVHQQTKIEAALAASHRVSNNVFAGLEARYLSAYQGYTFSEQVGHALFAGPTLAINIGQSGYAGLAWSIQLAGRAAQDPDRKLDLVNFERHQMRIKAGFSF